MLLTLSLALQGLWQLYSPNGIRVIPFVLCFFLFQAEKPCIVSLVNLNTQIMPLKHPSSPPKKPKVKRYTGFIWPKDPDPKQKSKTLKASRWLDLLTGKGPDIFLGNISHPRSYPSKPTWSQWSHVSGGVPLQTVSFLPCPSSLYSYGRSPTQLYDFRTRKYKEWTPEWHPAIYPCAYCCAPWRDCEHSDILDAVPAYHIPQDSMRRGHDYYDPQHVRKQRMV